MILFSLHLSSTLRSTEFLGVFLYEQAHLLNHFFTVAKYWKQIECPSEALIKISETYVVQNHAT